MNFYEISCRAKLRAKEVWEEEKYRDFAIYVNGSGVAPCYQSGSGHDGFQSPIGVARKEEV